MYINMFLYNNVYKFENISNSIYVYDHTYTFTTPLVERKEALDRGNLICIYIYVHSYIHILHTYIYIYIYNVCIYIYMYMICRYINTYIPLVERKEALDQVYIPT
jgi:hypothetical protein